MKRLMFAVLITWLATDILAADTDFAATITAEVESIICSESLSKCGNIDAVACSSLVSSGASSCSGDKLNQLMAEALQERDIDETGRAVSESKTFSSCVLESTRKLFELKGVAIECFDESLLSSVNSIMDQVRAEYESGEDD